MQDKTMSTRKIKAAETKKKIYETARQLILKHGFENVSVDSIVEAAEVSKGSFYVHFESKDALAVDLLNEFTSKADMDYKSFLSKIPDRKSVFDTLLMLAEKISDFMESDIGIDNMRILYKAHLTRSINTEAAMSYNRDLYKLFSEVLEMGILQGELRDDISVDSLAKHLILAIRGITFEWCIRYPDFNMKEQVVEHFKILLFGLKK